MTLLIVGYLPPPTFAAGFTGAFLTNFLRFKRTHPTLLFSEYDWTERLAGAEGVEFHRLSNSPEIITSDPSYRPDRSRPAVNNLVFYKSAQMAINRGATHMLYLETDCRVGCDDWDLAMVNELEQSGVEAAMAGSVVCYGTQNNSAAVSQRWEDMITRFNRKETGKHKHYPIPTYSAGAASEKNEPILLVNGALGIYSLTWLQHLFGSELNNCIPLALTSLAWDFEIGKRLWAKEGIKAFDRVVHLDCMYSSYGDVITSPRDRMALLVSGEKVAVHQIKSPWDGPERPEQRFSGQGQGTATGTDPEPARLPATPSATPKKKTKAKAKRLAAAPAQASSPDATAPPLDLDRGGVSNATTTPIGARTVRPATADGAVEYPFPFPHRVEVLYVTFRRDADWLNKSLASLRNNGSGFSGVCVAVPSRDAAIFEPICRDWNARLWTFNEWVGKAAGFYHHMAMVCSADRICPDADFVLHLDPDCIVMNKITPFDYFIGPDAVVKANVDPAQYARETKPVLVYELFDWIAFHGNRNELNWKEAAERALGFECKVNAMCRHPAVHYASTYRAVRQVISNQHKMPFEDYVMRCRRENPEHDSDFPQRFAEFPVLGSLAWNNLHPAYVWLRNSTERPPDRIRQFWSYQEPSEADKKAILAACFPQFKPVQQI